MNLTSYIWLVIPLVVVVSLVISSHLRKKRREDLKSIFSKMGYQFDEGPTELTNFNIQNLDLFQRGRNRRLENIAKIKINGHSLLYADYRYRTGSGKNSKTHALSVLYLQGAFSIPQLVLGHEDLFSKIAQAVGYQDIDLDSDPDFSKMFVLRGKDTDAIKRLFSPSILHKLKQNPKARVECFDDEMVYYQNKLVSPHDLRDWLEGGKVILQMLAH